MSDARQADLAAILSDCDADDLKAYLAVSVGLLSFVVGFTETQTILRKVEAALWDQRRKLSLSEIAGRVASHHGVSIADIRGRSRLKSAVAARHHFMSEALATRCHSSSQIGRWCDGRDHTSVLSARLAHAKREAALDALRTA